MANFHPLEIIHLAEAEWNSTNNEVKDDECRNPPVH